MTGPVQIIFGAERVEKAAFDVWPGGGRKGRGEGGEWRQSPPVSRAKQHHGNGLMLWRDEWQPVCQPPGRGEESQQRPAWHSRVGEQIPLLQLFSRASCWHSHFGTPAKDSMAYQRTDETNDICTGRSVHFSQTKNAHLSCCQQRIRPLKHSHASC